MATTPASHPPFFCRKRLHFMMAAKPSYDNFRVIIVGGGLAGLTLANALEQAGVQYVLLEARDDLAPNVGASMGIMSNGSRILDQLGCYDAIAELAYGIKWAGDHRETGHLIHPKSDGPQLSLQRSASGWISSRFAHPQDEDFRVVLQSLRIDPDVEFL